MTIGNLAAGALSALPAPVLAEAITRHLSGRPDAAHLRAQLLVNLINMHAPGMFGEEVVNTSPAMADAGRLAYTITPFAPLTGGAATVVIASDKNDVPHILLVKNPGAQAWSAPAGFMKQKSARNVQGVTVQDLPSRDSAEMAYLKKGEKFAAAVQELTTAPKSYDASLAHTAIRELAEETGLQLPIEKLHFVGEKTFDRNSKGADGYHPYQQQVNFYLADIRGQKNLPPITPADDVAEAVWVPLSAIENHSYKGSPLGSEAGFSGFEQAMRTLHENEYARFGVTEKAVTDAMAAQYPELHRPSSALGKEAMAWHEKALEVAAEMQQSWAHYVTTRSTLAAKGQAV